MSTDVNDFLLAGGVTSAKFPTIGTTVKGTVVSSTVSQQTDLAGKPKAWDNGDPMMQVVITIQTAERDDEDDDGLRKLYVKGQMTNAVREALRAAKAELEVGGTIAVQYASDKASDKPGHNPAKQYVAQYRPPAGDAASNDLLGAPAAAATAPTAPTADSLID